MNQPATRAEAVVDTLLGVQVPDPYRWLEDEKSPEVQAWMKAQDAFTREYLAALLQKCNGNISQMARNAGIARNYVHRLVTKYGLKAHE